MPRRNKRYLTIFGEGHGWELYNRRKKDIAVVDNGFCEGTSGVHKKRMRRPQRDCSSPLSRPSCYAISHFRHLFFPVGIGGQLIWD